MKLRKIGWFTAAIFFVLVGIFVATKRDKPRGIKLPDGTEIQLLAVGYERTNTFVYGTPGRTFLGRILPGPLKSKAGLSTFTTQIGRTNTPVFFARLQNEKGIHAELSEVAIYDEYGIEYSGNGGGSGTHYSSDKEQYRTWYRDIYGRSSRIAGLRLYANPEKTTLLADLHIPEVPLKSPMQIPFTHLLGKSDQGLEATLTSFTTGWQGLPDPDGRETNSLYSQITFRVSTNSRLGSSWFPDEIQIATNGGKYSSVRRNNGKRGDENVINLWPDLRSTNEVSLRLGLARHNGFSAEETCTFNNLPFPAAGEIVTTNATVQIQGVTLTLERVGAAGTMREGEPSQEGESYVLVRVSPPQKGLNVWLDKAVDQNGEDVGRAGYGPWKNGLNFYYFQPKAKAQKVNLTFTVHRTHYFEFKARPISITSDLAHSSASAKP